jgi:multidrug resistance efflux pump
MDQQIRTISQIQQEYSNQCVLVGDLVVALDKFPIRLEQEKAKAGALSDELREAQRKAQEQVNSAQEITKTEAQ